MAITYYNPEIIETITRSELIKLLNASVPSSAEYVQGWYLLHDGTKPETTDYTYLTKGDIEEVDGVYYQTYTLTEYPVASVRSRLLESLDDAFLKWRDDTATFVSSLGFTADGDSRAMLDIAGLATLAENDPEYTDTFMDADNEAHTLTADDILILQNEVIQSGKDAYTQKWTLRAAIEAATTVDELSEITIEFTPSDFSA